jgi:hypothetical protein
MKLLSLLIGFAVAFVASGSADAAVYNFTIDSVDYDVAGQITTTGDLVTSITGNVTGLLVAPISGIEGQPNIHYTSDNIINSFAPIVSNSGVLFSAGGFFFNIYSVENGPTFDYFISTNQFGADYFTNPLFNPGSLILSGTIAAVPELSTWMMMIVGFSGLYIAGFRRRNRIVPFHSN